MSKTRRKLTLCQDDDGVSATLSTEELVVGDNWVETHSKRYPMVSRDFLFGAIKKYLALVGYQEPTA